MQNEKIFAPAVSIVIPMYNAEKFIRQCLISVLASKFTDFEVIVVDDCSVDASFAEASKLLSHFDGRLKIISTDKNSGGAGIPRNFGIQAAQGKYITFVDNDDMLLPTALNIFFEIAESFNADVIHTEKTFIFNDDGDGAFNREDLKLQSDEPHDLFVDSPTAETKDLNERVNRYVAGRFFWLPWGKFYRRAFLTENKIYFPQMKFSEDMVFCFKCLCLAENYIRIPNVTNIHRVRQNSVSKSCGEPIDGVKDWLSVVIKGVEIIDEFMKSMKFFRSDTASSFKVLNFFIEKHFKFIAKLFDGVPVHEAWKMFFDNLEIYGDSRSRKIIEAYLYTRKFFN